MPSIRAADGEVEIALTVDAVDREAYTYVASDGTTSQRREALQASHFTTAGELERQFSVIEHDDSETSTIRVGWTPPEPEEQAIPDAGMLVRFTIVVRDGRGGLDVTSRAVCLVP